LLHCLTAGGIDYAVIVHPEPYQDDHRYLDHCLAVGRGRFKATCLVFADRPDPAGRLRDLATRLALVAVRVHAYAPDRLPPFDAPSLRQLWSQAADLGLAVQLHFEPRHAPRFEPLIQAFPKTPVIVDHLGRPFQGTPQEHAVVLGWSRFQNVHIKLSGIPSPLTYPHRDVAPVVEGLIERFGAARMIYGGGFGPEATGTSYRAAFEAGRSYLTSLGASDQALVLGGNAARLFGFSTG
jgi:predicted TIM-barrel fold metal-dependent hydrolase